MKIIIFIFGAIFGLIIGVFIMGKSHTVEFYEYDKFFQENKSWLQNYNAVEREKIWEQYQHQKELTDFADKQKALYK